MSAPCPGKSLMVVAAAVLVLALLATPAVAGVAYDIPPPGWPADAQSTTGPRPPSTVIQESVAGAVESPVLIAGVPPYLWHQGCGPSALGMVLGYWDSRGYPDLIPGDASTQTSLVDAAIGSAGNYYDYCLPLDDPATNPTPLPDRSEPPFGDEHPDDCIADFMFTSQSYRGNHYGWSWFSDVGLAVSDYVHYRNAHYYAASQGWRYDSALTWETFQAEIQAGRPLVLLVDSNADGRTDHFVAAIGYGSETETGTPMYACYTTWDPSLHWHEFRGMNTGDAFGIYGAITSDLVQLRFTDVPPDFWAYDSIEAVAKSSIAAGYPDGTYKPEFSVSRDQMAVFISRSICTPTGEAGLADYVPPETPSFSDVPTGYWAYKHIEYAVEQNVVAGYEEGTYHPEYQVTRDQMAVYVARSLVAPTGEAALADYVPTDPRNFPDVTSDFWAYHHIEYCVEHGVVQGYEDGYYHPEIVVTRDQMAVYIARAFCLPL